jgi:hypothetical protein
VEKPALIARALATAEEAVAADERDALAHFAVFCASGEQARLSGVSLTSLFGARRMRREVDRTLALAPDFADALLGKGALLSELPRLLGGDPAEGERLVRRALAVDPDYFGARMRLARILAGRGAGPRRGPRPGARSRARSGSRTPRTPRRRSGCWPSWAADVALAGRRR